MADHSQNWYNGATTWQGRSYNSNDIVVITKRVDSFGCDMQKLQESIPAIQVGCKICEEVHLTKECPLNEDGKEVKQVKYIGLLEETINKFMEESNKKQVAFDEWIRKFIDYTDLNLRMLDVARKNLQERAEQKPIEEEDALRLNDRCSTALQNQPPPKENDLGSFTLPCLIVDFVIMDMVEDPNVPLILERPLLVTAHAQTDVFNKQILLGVEEERILFKMNELVDDPYITHESIYMIKCSRETHEEELKLLLASDP
ncbi:hypothetical protein Tco_0580168 [Tanacetum coccineum]